MMNMKGMGKGKGKGKGGGNWGGYSQAQDEAWKAKWQVDRSGGELGEMTGTIKSYGDRKGYGFITSDDAIAQGHGDVFLHGAETKGYKPGQSVKFTCVLTKEGKPVAIDLKSGLK